MFKFVIQTFTYYSKRAKAKDLLAASATGPAASTVSLAASLATTSSATTMSHLIKFVITLSKKKKFA